MPEDLASSLNGKKDGKQKKKPKSKKEKKDKKKDKKAKKHGKNGAAAAAAAAKDEGHDSDGSSSSSSSSVSSGSAEKDFVQRGKSERQLRNAAKTLLPALHEHAAEDGSSSIDSDDDDDASSNDPFSTAVDSTRDPLQLLSQHAPEHQQRRSSHSAARVRRSTGGLSGHSSPANMARSPHVHPELLEQQRLSANPQEKPRSSLAKAKARQRAQQLAYRGGGNLERAGSYGEDLDLSAPSAQSSAGGMEFSTLNPLAVASARRSGRSNGNINRSTTLDLGAETKIRDSPLRQNLS